MGAVKWLPLVGKRMIEHEIVWVNDEIMIVNEYRCFLSSKSNFYPVNQHKNTENPSIVDHFSVAKSLESHPCSFTRRLPEMVDS